MCIRDRSISRRLDLDLREVGLLGLRRLGASREKSEHRTDRATDEVGRVRDMIVVVERAHDLAAEIDHRDAMNDSGISPPRTFAIEASKIIMKATPLAPST